MALQSAEMIEIIIKVDEVPERQFYITKEEETVSPKGNKVCRYRVNDGFDVWHFPDEGLLMLARKVLIKVNRKINKAKKNDRQK